MNTLKDAADYGPPLERELRLAGINIAAALLRAKMPEDHRLLQEMERAAAKVSLRRTEQDSDESVRLPVPVRQYDSGFEDASNTNGSKMLLLDIVDAALAAANIASDRTSERGMDGRIDRHELDEAVRRTNSRERGMAEARIAAEKIIIGLVAHDDTVAAILGRTPTPRSIVDDEPAISAVIAYLIRRRLANTMEVAKALAYLFGAPWTSRKNYFSKALLTKWAARRQRDGLR